MAASSRYLSFRAGGRVQTVPADAVREVVRLPRTTRVPHAPAGVVGLANVRGTALPVLSVAVLQGKPAASGDRVLVLDHAPAVGLLVEEVRALSATRGRSRPLDLDALIGAAMRQAPARATAPLARGTAVPSAGLQGEAEATLGLLAFVSAGQEFALPLDEAVEVLATPASVTPLPDADAAVLGTIEHRGGLLPILVLAELLGLADRAAGTPARVVVTRIKGHRVGLAVTAMRSVLSVPAMRIDPVPGVIARRAGEARIQAIARLDGGRLVSILAADELLHEELIAQLAGRQDAQEKGEDMANRTDATEPFLVFRLGGQSFGLPAREVDAVVRVPDALTRLPRAPAFVEGVMNLRGRAIPVIDQRRRFGGEGSADLRRRAIVVRVGALVAAFLVDEVTRIHRIDAAAIAPAPDLSVETRMFDRTAVMSDGGIVLLIEPAELLDSTERELLSALRADPVGASA